MNVKTSRFIKLSITLLLMSFSCLQYANAKVDDNTQKPNIVFLMADDLGFGELGVYGQKKIKTPFLDELAKQSMRFTDFYAGNAVCSPSRAVLMTGIHSGHSSIRGNKGYHSDRKKVARIGIRPDEVTLGEMLKQGGYETLYFGKWHLDDPYDLTTWAASRGFDYAVQGQWKRNGGEFDIDSNYDWVNGLTEAKYYDYTKYSCMDEFRTEQAIDYFEQRQDNKPFFLFMSYRIPHGNETQIRNHTMYKAEGWPEIERQHAAKITMLDEQVGRLMRYLKAIGELENTLIIVTSDNGGHSEKNHDYTFFESNGDLKGYKRDLYEGGIRVPFFAIWPGKIKPGQTSDHIGAFQDIMPTLAEVAGIKVPAQSEGISLLSVLQNKPQAQHPYLYWELHLNKKGKNGNDKSFRQAIRQGKWKAVRYGINSKTELYNLARDVGELKNIAAKYPEKTAELTELFKASNQETPHYKYGGNFLSAN